MSFLNSLGYSDRQIGGQAAPDPKAVVKTVTVSGMGGAVVVPVMVGPKMSNGGFWGWQS